jgi:hypothetical protein
MKVAMRGSGADEFVVVKKLLQWRWSEGIQLSSLQESDNRKGGYDERRTIA